MINCTGPPISLTWRHWPFCGDGMDKLKIDPSYTLMQALEYDSNDLKANRDGELGAWQISRLRRMQRKQLGSFSTRLTWALVFLFMGILSAKVNPLANAESVLVFLIVMVGGFLYSSRPLSVGFLLYRDERRGKINVVEGHIRLDIIEKDKYAVSMGEERFDVSKETFLAFKNNDPYWLYYVPFSDTLVAAEWLYDGGFFADDSADEISDEDDGSLGNLIASQG